MQIGVVFPQTEIGASVDSARNYAETVDRFGYRHLLIYDHVLGADPQVHAPWKRPYDVDTTFHEPFVLFGYLAAVTSLELVTGIIILPQRQTALVAKQATEVDLLSGGRLRLGIGIGWNAVEFDALGKNFADRGRRSEEQVALLRALWTERSVTFRGEYEQVVGAGINPLPIQRPIPIWFGAQSLPAYRRTGRLADGWFPQIPPGPGLDEARATIGAAAQEAGRDPKTIGMESRVTYTGDLTQLLDEVERWRDEGASHLSINTMNAGLGSVDRHLEVLAQVADRLALIPRGSI